MIQFKRGRLLSGSFTTSWLSDYSAVATDKVSDDFSTCYWSEYYFYWFILGTGIGKLATWYSLPTRLFFYSPSFVLGGSKYCSLH